jgi:peptidoglycan/LPS O-acetylase OafA/YrhL
MRNFIMVDWHDVAVRSAPWAAFYWLTGFGRIAVIVFFVLSGYLVGGRALSAIEADAFGVRAYTINRLSRLYPPLLAAIVLTALIDSIGLAYGNRLGYYDYPNSYGIAGETHAVAQSLTWPVALANLGFLQWIVAPTFGSNSPLWSLSNEFWYYVFGPVFMLLGHRARLSAGVVLVLIPLSVIVGRLAGLEIVTLFSTWLAGAAAWRHSRACGLALLSATAILFLGVIAAVRTLQGSGTIAAISDLAIAASFALVLLVAGRAADGEGGDLLSRINARMAGFSYSLYLVHVPVCFLLAAVVLQRNASTLRLQPGSGSLATFGLGLGTAMALAWLVSRLTEARTVRVRRRLSRHADELIKWVRRAR